MDSDLEHVMGVAFGHFRSGDAEAMIRTLRQSDFFDDFEEIMSLADMAMELDNCANGRGEKLSIFRAKCVVAALFEEAYAAYKKREQTDKAILNSLRIRTWVGYDSARRAAFQEIADNATRELLDKKIAEFEIPAGGPN